VGGRREVGLADAEIDDVASLRGQRGGAGQHRKGVLLADAVEGGDGFQHGVPRWVYAGGLPDGALAHFSIQLDRKMPYILESRMVLTANRYHFAGTCAGLPIDFAVN
jgi:hypothetical protein